MKLWRFADPNDYRYARAGLRGTWKGSPQTRGRPLVIEWEAGSDVVGDFVWPGFDSDIAVSERAGNALVEAGVSGFQLGEVVMTGAGTRRWRDKRVLLPYEGPRLFDLWVTASVIADAERSSFRAARQAGSPGIEGIERIDSRWSREKAVLVKEHHPRSPGCGIFVRGDAVAGADIFRVTQCSNWIFCTDAVRTLIVRMQFTNVSFLEMGDVLE